ncbi:MAG: hypothetical protein K2O08_06440 [Clostridia bacterium]|nr:hypothetical protein [Clostridia bacterium]
MSISDGAYLPTESINVAGTYRIKLYMPDDLKLMYILDESLYEIQLNIKDAPPQDEEIPPIDDSEEPAPPNDPDENDKPDEIPDIVDGDDNDDTYFEENKTYSDVLKGVCAAGASAVGVVAIGLSVNKRVRRKKK